MPKQLNTIVKTVLLSIVTTTAMAQQNPFAVLQQIQKAVEQVQGNAGSASPEKTVQPTIPAGTIATGKDKATSFL
jgi:hypothetical protein